MSFWSVLLIILKNFKYILEFAKLVDNAIQKGITEAEIKESLIKLDKGFKRVITKKDTAAGASDINDSFRM